MTIKPESFSESLAKDSVLNLWQAYCDKKMEIEHLTEVNRLLMEALEWIVRVNAMDYEYKQKAREALAKVEGTE
jgi:L-rhamnose isomerase